VRIRSMNASFGKLNHATLSLHPGLNVIYAPNESGKSTWCHFIRVMLYGLPRRERGALADKNRFAPWSGVPMAGVMELESRRGNWTVTRSTASPTSPMGEFSCTYSGTAVPVEGITAQDLGESLLGVGREVFARSAFIGQGAIAFGQDAELERRISALMTSGEEEVSFSESYERLKKQLNRRRHNKTGRLPLLEQEIRSLRSTLDTMQELLDKETAAREQLQQYSRQAEELQLRLTQWEALEKQAAVRRFRAAQADALAAQQRADALAEAQLPLESELQRLIGMAQTLDQTLSATEAAGEEALQTQDAAAEAQELWHSHPLYPADDGQLAEQKSALARRIKPFPFLFAALALLLGGTGGAGLWFWQGDPLLAAAAGGGLFLLLLLAAILIRRRENGKARSALTELEESCQSYLFLRQEAQVKKAEAERSAAVAHSLHRSCRQTLAELVQHTRPFAPQVSNLTNIRAALDQAILRRRMLDRAREEAQQAQLQCRLLRDHLPQEPLPDADEPLPRPTTSAEQLRHALPRVMAGAQAAQSELDRLSGQLSAMGERDALESRLSRKEAEHRQLQSEYDAILLAMDALQAADSVVQSRFSPLLSRHAAEIFSALTEGAYDKVLFSRDFSLAAQGSEDIAPHSIQLLSQGAADQLYLAMRLAICRTVLPQEPSVPLILDDALANFDERRMAAALDWLADEGEHRQILLFTCQRRESDYLAGRSGVHFLRL